MTETTAELALPWAFVSTLLQADPSRVSLQQHLIPVMQESEVSHDLLLTVARNAECLLPELEKLFQANPAADVRAAYWSRQDKTPAEVELFLTKEKNATVRTQVTTAHAGRLSEKSILLSANPSTVAGAKYALGHAQAVSSPVVVQAINKLCLDAGRFSRLPSKQVEAVLKAAVLPGVSEILAASRKSLPLHVGLVSLCSPNTPHSLLLNELETDANLASQVKLSPRRSAFSLNRLLLENRALTPRLVSAILDLPFGLSLPFANLETLAQWDVECDELKITALQMSTSATELYDAWQQVADDGKLAAAWVALRNEHITKEIFDDIEPYLLATPDPVVNTYMQLWGPLVFPQLSFVKHCQSWVEKLADYITSYRWPYLLRASASPEWEKVFVDAVLANLRSKSTAAVLPLVSSPHFPADRLGDLPWPYLEAAIKRGLTGPDKVDAMLKALGEVAYDTKQATVFANLSITETSLNDLAKAVSAAAM